MDTEGNLQIKSETSYKALCYDDFQSLMHDYSKEQQLVYLKKTLNLPTYSVTAFQYTEDNSSRLPVIHETLDLSVTAYAHVTGKRIFITPDILRRSTTKLPEEKERKLDFQFKDESREIDSVEIKIPGGYMVESQPKDLLLETKYGRFQTSLQIKEDKILYHRYADQYSGRFPASSCEEIRTYFNRIYDADQAQIVLVKKELKFKTQSNRRP